MSDELIQPAEVKQKCCMCPLIARTFVDVPWGNGQKKRLYLCQQDAYALLRIIAKEQAAAFIETFIAMDETVYGNEESVLHRVSIVGPCVSINGGPL